MEEPQSNTKNPQDGNTPAPLLGCDGCDVSFSRQNEQLPRRLGTTDKHAARKMETQTPLGARRVPVRACRRGARAGDAQQPGPLLRDALADWTRPSGLCPHPGSSLTGLTPTTPRESLNPNASPHPNGPFSSRGPAGTTLSQEAPSTETHAGPETLPPEAFSHCVLNPRRHTARRTYRHTTPCRAMQRQLLTVPASGGTQALLHNRHALGQQGRLSSSTGCHAAPGHLQELAPNHPTGKMQESVLNSSLSGFGVRSFHKSFLGAHGAKPCSGWALEIQQLWDRVSLCSAYVLGRTDLPQVNSKLAESP